MKFIPTKQGGSICVDERKNWLLPDGTPEYEDGYYASYNQTIIVGETEAEAIENLKNVLAERGLILECS